MMKTALTTLAMTLAFSTLALAAGPSKHGANVHLLPPPPVDVSKATRPDPVVIEAPAPLSKVSGSETILRWKPSEGATHYMLQVASDPNFKWIIVNEANVQETNYPIKGLESGKQYHWRVFGIKGDNEPSFIKGDAGRSMFEVR